jgi:hypothetical protein
MTDLPLWLILLAIPFVYWKVVLTVLVGVVLLVLGLWVWRSR